MKDFYRYRLKIRKVGKKGKHNKGSDYIQLMKKKFKEWNIKNKTREKNG